MADSLTAWLRSCPLCLQDAASRRPHLVGRYQTLWDGPKASLQKEPGLTFCLVCLQPVIDTEKALELKFRMLDVLSDIEVAQVCGVARALGFLLQLRQELSGSCCNHVPNHFPFVASQKVAALHVGLGAAA